VLTNLSVSSKIKVYTNGDPSHDPHHHCRQGGFGIDVGLPEPVAKDNALAVAWMGDGDCDYVTDDGPQILARPAGSFGQFAVDYADAFPWGYGGDGPGPARRRLGCRHEHGLRIKREPTSRKVT
jgi:hypothetical protein